MKRSPYTYGVDLTGKQYWRSLDELARSPEFQRALAREFPEGASELKEGMSRRTFLSLMGASIGLAGLAACRRPVERILPYARAPEQIVPGRPRYFATAMPFAGSAIGLVAESHEGRPTKLEGNALHPDSLGATHAFAQASLLDLYDPDRSAGPVARDGAPRTWEEAEAWLAERGALHRSARGKGLALLVEERRSPTEAALLERLARELPEARIYRHELFSRGAVREGARIAFGRPMEPLYALDEAQVVLALDADLFTGEGRPIRQMRDFAKSRRVERPGDSMSRLYAVESRFSLTGASADHRLRLKSGELLAFMLPLARELGAVHGVELGQELSLLAARAPLVLGREQLRFAEEVARDLATHRGRGLIVVGEGQPAALHALAALLNEGLSNTGRTLHWVRAFDEEVREPLAALAASAERGEVETLLILGGNPLFTAPGALHFERVLSKVAQSAHLGEWRDETSERCAWHLNRAHYLESWGDVRALDGTASIVQPLIAPLHGGRTDAEVMSLLLGERRSAYELVRAQWRAQYPATFEASFDRALHDGLFADGVGAPYARERPAVRRGDTARALSALAVEHSQRPSQGLELTFAPDAHAYDGRFANNGWLQELPEPMTKLTWDNAALMAPATAARLGLIEGDLLELSVGERRARVPMLLSPGQAEDSLALTLGQGRRAVGRVGSGVGFDVAPLLSAAGARLLWGARALPTGASHELARTQEHSAMEGRALVREATLARFAAEPDFAGKMVEHPPLKSLFPDHVHEGHRWGMSIDLNSCVGCNACMVACQAENNIPIVGKRGVLRSREMHWIRIDRYFEGSGDAPRAVFQPIACQQCENAPCEQVCPVGATTHSPEGLNDMAYNRCVGTRYCANNCPYKVRRFNFFNYTKGLTETQRMQQNPDVSVRSRGVMEKCTFCVQRIEEARQEATREGKERIADGRIRTACQQACPTEAIVFGDLADAESQVAKRSAEPRRYKILEELNVRPRTTFLARLSNPNPALEQSQR